MDATEDLMRRAAAAAARVLADLWPDGRAVAHAEDVSAMHFVVAAEHDGVVVRRTGEVMGSALWDVIDLGESEPFKLLDGARRTPDGNVSVELPARRSAVGRGAGPRTRSRSSAGSSMRSTRW